MLPQSTYRSDIDGLRAIAVLAVLLFHFEVWPFTGGFVGVDVFFVISGYLITRIILGEAKAGTFSFAGFYTRRSRRLLPALLVTVAGAYAAGVLFFSAQDLVQLSRSTIAAVMAVSNILFWTEADYFDTEAILKPLLHTWSLAVEFQFYLIWPALLWVLSRAKSRSVVQAGIALAACVSFIASLAMLAKDPSGAFYLTPFRIHEFALGGSVVLLEARRRPRWLAELLYPAGLAAVLAGLFLFGDQTPFPSYAVLAPSLGTAAMIYAGASARSSWLLRTAPMRGIGAISYSLYLVHWPLWVFTRYRVSRELTGLEMLGLIAATFVLGLLLYRFVETVFRKPKPGRLSSATAFTMACVAAAALIVAPAMASWLGKGWVWRLPSAVQEANKTDIERMKVLLWDKHRSLREAPLDSKIRNILIIGDSQSADFLNILTAMPQIQGVAIRTIEVLRFCATLYIPEGNSEHFWSVENHFTAKSPRAVQECKDTQLRILSSEYLQQADEIYIANYWYPWAIPYIRGTVEKIQEKTRAKIYVLGRKDLSLSSIQILNRRGRLSNIEQYAAKFVDPETRAINEEFRAKVGSNFIDLFSLECPSKDACYVLTEAGKPIFWDRTHLTPEGAHFFARRFSLPQAPRS